MLCDILSKSRRSVRVRCPQADNRRVVVPNRSSHFTINSSWQRLKWRKRSARMPEAPRLQFCPMLVGTETLPMQSHLEQLLDAFDDTLPLELARTIPSSWYFDAEIFDLERRKVFADTWQLAARADQLQRPGDFATLDVAGEPIVVVRDDDGVLRAFYNVCRHRAAQVVTAECGTASKLRCRYHGWTYDLRGRLRGVPEFAGVREFCKGDEGLVPVHVAAWGPMVFVHLGMNPEDLVD